MEVPVYNNGDKTSFAYPSARERWPLILTSSIDDVHRTVIGIENNQEAVEEGKKIIEQITALKYEIGHDKELKPFEYEKYEDLADYNRELQRLGPLTWLSAPWLFSECYMYRKISLFFSQTNNWKNYDVYKRQKEDAFKKSGFGVTELAARYKALAAQLKGLDSGKQSDSNALYILFREFVDISLWGNATDLSLLTNVSLEDIKSLQGAEVRKKNEKNILVNDIDKVWKLLSNEEDSRVDFVLDNAGFELYADLMLALFILDAKLAKTIVLHPKAIPWFVSDVITADISNLLVHLGDEEFFDPKPKSSHIKDLKYVAEKINEYYEKGQIQIRTNAFWTSYESFWELNANGSPRGVDVWEDLNHSNLIIFKGDLNHRKLLRDAVWPRTTPFEKAIGPLASSGLRVLTLRTCKGDVVVGLKPGLEQELENDWIKAGNSNKLGWAYSGKYAVIQFHDGRN